MLIKTELHNNIETINGCHYRLENGRKDNIYHGIRDWQKFKSHLFVKSVRIQSYSVLHFTAFGLKIRR